MYGTIRPNIKPATVTIKDYPTVKNNSAYAAHVAQRQESMNLKAQEMKEWMKKNK